MGKGTMGVYVLLALCVSAFASAQPFVVTHPPLIVEPVNGASTVFFHEVTNQGYLTPAINDGQRVGIGVALTGQLDQVSSWFPFPPAYQFTTGPNALSYFYITNWCITQTKETIWIDYSDFNNVAPPNHPSHCLGMNGINPITNNPFPNNGPCQLPIPGAPWMWLNPTGTTGSTLMSFEVDSSLVQVPLMCVDKNPDPNPSTCASSPTGCVASQKPAYFAVDPNSPLTMIYGTGSSQQTAYLGMINGGQMVDAAHPIGPQLTLTMTGVPPNPAQVVISATPSSPSKRIVELKIIKNLGWIPWAEWTHPQGSTTPWALGQTATVTTPVGLVGYYNAGTIFNFAWPLSYYGMQLPGSGPIQYTELYHVYTKESSAADATTSSNTDGVVVKAFGV